MTKAKKKRTKKYTGSDAATPSSEPIIYRVQAIDRGRVGQWWYEKKRVLKPVIIAAGAMTLVIWLVSELVALVVD